jgi:hypothetical protein
MTFTPPTTFAPGQSSFAANLNNMITSLAAYTDTTATGTGTGRYTAGLAYDGSDETTTAQAALTAGSLVLQPNKTLTHGGLTIPSGAVFDGNGSTIKLKNGAAAGTHVLRTSSFTTLVGTDGVANGESGFSVRNLQIDGNKANNASGGHGLAIFGYAYRLHNVVVRNAHGRGIHSEWNSTSNLTYTTGEQFECFWNNVRVMSNDGNGIHFDGPHDSYASGVNPIQNGGHGLYCAPKSLGTVFLNVHSWGVNHDEAIRVDGTGINIINFQGEGARNAQLHVRANDGAFLGGNVYNGFQAAGTNKGIQIGDTGVAVATTRIDAYTHGLDAGHLILTNDAGANDIKLLAYNGATDPIIVGTPNFGSRVDVQINGNSGWTGALPFQRNANKVDFRTWDAQDRFELDLVNKVLYLVNGIDSRWYSDQFSTMLAQVKGDTGLMFMTGLRYNRGTVAGGGTMDALHTYWAVTGSGARSVTLPSAATVGAGFRVIVKDEAGNAAAGNITVNRAGTDTIEGATTSVITTNYGVLSLLSTGSTWVKV